MAFIAGQWHHLVAKRYHQDGLLELDGSEDRVTGSTVGSLRTLNIVPQIWIGGLNSKAMMKTRRGRRNEYKGGQKVVSGFIGNLTCEIYAQNRNV